MFLFQFVKHGQPPTAPQPGAAHTSGLENWGWIFLSFRTWISGFANLLF